METSLRLSDQLCFSLYATSKAVTQAYQPFLAPLGITYPQYLALLVLWETDGLLVKEIGDRLELDSGTLTPLLKRLEAAGLVRRRRGTVDQRQVRIELTSSGKSLRRRAEGVPERLLCRYGALDASALEGLAALRSALDALRAGLAAPADGPPRGP